MRSCDHLVVSGPVTAERLYGNVILITANNEGSRILSLTLDAAMV